MINSKHSLTIDGKVIKNFGAPYTIAEVSGNHMGDIVRAKKLIKAAKDSNFSAVKLQFFTADEMTLDISSDEFVIASGLWKGRKLYDVYQEGAMPESWLSDLFEYSKTIGITIFSSVFSEYGIEVLEALGCPAYKIASFEAMDLALIEAAIKTGKPLIVSTGIIDKEGIDDIFALCKQYQFEQLGLMHCVSNYPAPSDEFNLSTLREMIETYNVPIGLSDHSYDDLAATLSIAMGGCIVEKHITIARDDGAIDSEFSLPIDAMPHFIDKLMEAYSAIGAPKYESSSPRKNYRSLYVVKEIQQGELITSRNIRSIRPGYGLAPKHLNSLIGKRVNRTLKVGTPVSWEIFND